MRGTISAFVYGFFKCINEHEVINEGDVRGKDLHAQCLNYFLIACASQSLCLLCCSTLFNTE